MKIYLFIFNVIYSFFKKDVKFVLPAEAEVTMSLISIVEVCLIISILKINDLLEGMGGSGAVFIFICLLIINYMFFLNNDRYYYYNKNEKFSKTILGKFLKFLVFIGIIAPFILILYVF